MSLYFELHYSIEPKVVGVRNGLGQAATDAAFYERNPWFHELFSRQPGDQNWWKRRANLPDYGQPLQRLNLFKVAKLTDFIHACLTQGYIVSDRVRALLADYVLPRHRYFEVTFQRGEEVIGGYWWLVYDLDDGSQTVDFAQSEFVYSWLKPTPERVQVQNYAQYLALLEERGGAAKATKLVFTSQFDQNLDLWGPQFLSVQKGYLSSRLLHAFQEQKITGYEIRNPRCPLSFLG